MNNRYTFKAKRKDGTKYDGKWVFGYYHQLNEYGKIIDCIIEFNRGTSTPIDINTLCACTGLQDIEGNYIFENDNIKYCEVCFEEPTDEELKNLCINEWEYGTVIFGIEQGYPAFDLDKHDFDSNAFSYMIATGYTIKIIGNKFDKDVE